MNRGIEVGEGRFRVCLQVLETDGRGLCVLVCGGQTPHVGGVALALPRPSLAGEGASCDVSQLCVPSHKDVEVAARMARRLSVATGQVVVVSAGLHVDGATPEDVERLVRAADEATEVWLARHGVPVEDMRLEATSADCGGAALAEGRHAASTDAREGQVSAVASGCRPDSYDGEGGLL